MEKVRKAVDTAEGFSVADRYRQIIWECLSDIWFEYGWTQAHIASRILVRDDNKRASWSLPDICASMMQMIKCALYHVTSLSSRLLGATWYFIHLNPVRVASAFRVRLDGCGPVSIPIIRDYVPWLCLKEQSMHMYSHMYIDTLYVSGKLILPFQHNAPFYIIFYKYLWREYKHHGHHQIIIQEFAHDMPWDHDT